MKLLGYKDFKFNDRARSRLKVDIEDIPSARNWLARHIAFVTETGLPWTVCIDETDIFPSCLNPRLAPIVIAHYTKTTPAEDVAGMCLVCETNEELYDLLTLCLMFYFDFRVSSGSTNLQFEGSHDDYIQITGKGDKMAEQILAAFRAGLKSD